MSSRAQDLTSIAACDCSFRIVRSLDRRAMLGTCAAILAAAAGVARARDAPALPSEVAGVTVPRSALALRVTAFARSSCPEFLFNHCMRSFLFGAVHAERLRIRYDPDTAFAAAALHDCGLLPAFASRKFSFEIDGANSAEAFLHGNGAPAAERAEVWNAIAMHAMQPQFAEHQSGAAVLLNA